MEGAQLFAVYLMLGFAFFSIWEGRRKVTEFQETFKGLA